MKTLNIQYINPTISFQEEINSFLENWFDSSESIFTKTSGSTGKPKTIELSKEKMKVSARMTGKFLELNKNDSALLCLPINTIAGKMMIVRAIELELKLIACSPSSNPLEDIDLSIDFAAFVPLQLVKILSNSVDKLISIQNCIIGGGSVSKEIENQLIANKITVFQTFGMTETISHIAMRKIGFESESHYTAIGENYFSSIENQLIIHSPLLNFEPLKTNDIVELISPQKFIWKGRADFVINSGGVKIQPEIVELKISAFISLPFFISSIKDPSLGEKVILCIENREEFAVSKGLLKSTLDRFEVPKEIYFFEQFIYTESNKINRIQTKEHFLKHAIRQVL